MYTRYLVYAIALYRIKIFHFMGMISSTYVIRFCIMAYECFIYYSMNVRKLFPQNKDKEIYQFKYTTLFIMTILSYTERVSFYF